VSVGLADITKVDHLQVLQPVPVKVMFGQNGYAGLDSKGGPALAARTSTCIPPQA
jgi:hypothetical protein